jgi:Family of unknown function (DUF6346)
VRAVVLCLAAVVGFLLTTTAMRTMDVLVGPPAADATGTAAVVSCVEHGPVGLWGFGTSYGCTADVRWDGGRVERLDFLPGQLLPGDTGIAVYSSAERGAPANPGRNDSARWFVAGRAATVVLALLTFWFVLGALASMWQLLWRQFRSPRPAVNPAAVNPAADSTKPNANGTKPDAGSAKPDATGAKPDAEASRPREWPVTKADIAAAPVTSTLWRLRLLAAVCLGAGALEALASIIRFDAPRRIGGFVSPWPHLSSAWLVDPPSGTFVVVGAVGALLCLLMAGTVRRNAARVTRYGDAYLEHAHRNLKPGRSSLIGTVVLAALTAWAAVSAVRATPPGVSLPVWFAGGRDVLILLSLTVIWLVTRQTSAQTIEQLRQRHHETSRLGTELPAG